MMWCLLPSWADGQTSVVGEGRQKPDWPAMCMHAKRQTETCSMGTHVHVLWKVTD